MKVSSIAIRLPYILTAAAIAAGLWAAVPQEGTVEETVEETVAPVNVFSPARIEVHIPYHEDVTRTASGTIYCDAVPLSNGWQLYTQECCKEFGIDYPLMLGLMETESSFREDADSGWAYGLCQIGYINEESMAELGMDIYTTEGNIRAGCYILSDLLSRHSTSEALMAYNMGEAGAYDWWMEGFSESAYSKAVMEAADRWEERLR